MSSRIVDKEVIWEIWVIWVICPECESVDQCNFRNLGNLGYFTDLGLLWKFRLFQGWGHLGKGWLQNVKLRPLVKIK